MGKVCTFFGHRDYFSADSSALTIQIQRVIEDHGITEFWCGGHGGFDSSAARAVHSLKQTYPQIQLLLIHAYLPKPGQSCAPIYDDSIFPEGLESVPKRYAISHRNRWMVKNCDLVIAYVAKSFGGAYTACQYARHLEKPVFDLFQTAP